MNGTRISLYVDKDVHNQIQQTCKEFGISKSDFITKGMYEFMTSPKHKTAKTKILKDALQNYKFRQSAQEKTNKSFRYFTVLNVFEQLFRYNQKHFRCIGTNNLTMSGKIIDDNKELFNNLPEEEQHLLKPQLIKLEQLKDDLQLSEFMNNTLLIRKLTEAKRK